MRGSILLRVAAVVALATAHNHDGDWVQGLPSCWVQCLDETDSGCDLSTCICSASQSNSFLPPAVSCAASNCDSDDFDKIGPFLFSVQAYCGAAGNPVPTEIISSAYCAATETATPKASSTKHAQHTSIAHTSKDSGDSVTKTITTTVTQTTTDSNSNTIVIIVPIVVGPSSISLGDTITSTVDGKSSATSSPSSASASPSATPGTSAAASTQARQSQVASSTTSSKAAQKTQANSNGSPFENMQNGGGRWGVSAILVGLGAGVGALLRL